MLNMNIKINKVHEYSISQLMLKFEFKFHHFDITSHSIVTSLQTIDSLFEHQYQIFAIFRNENRLLVNEAVSYTHDYHKHIQCRQRISASGDLVLIRNHVLNEQKGRKLEAR